MTAAFSKSLIALVFLSVTSAQQEGDLRLVNGPTSFEGRVEIYHNNLWGTVCDDQFGDKDAQVICTNLGLGKLEQAYGKAKYGAGSGQIWMDGLECNGDENKLEHCSFDYGFRRWGYHDCRHSEDASVRCSPSNFQEQVAVETQYVDVPVRISCPHNHGESCKACPNNATDKCARKLQVRGILEANYKGSWYPISGEGWSASHARTACGQLGYPAPWPIPPIESLWPTSDQQYLSRVVFDNLKCTGFEQTLLNCSFTNLAPRDNPSLKIATLACGTVPAQSEECLGTAKDHEVMIQK